MLLRISFSHAYMQLGRGSWEGREGYYCPLVFATGTTCFFPPTWACIQRLSSTEHLARHKRVGSVSSYRHRDRSFNEDVGVQNAEGERMRCPFTSPSHALFL